MIEPLSLQKSTIRKADKETDTAGHKRLAWTCQTQQQLQSGKENI